jgi:predicted RNA-binding Zn ribbon-like protein
MTQTTTFLMLAGRPALDFCNTRLGGKELLGHPGDLERWLLEAGLAERRPAISPAELDAARELRDALRPALLASDRRRVARLAESWLDGAPVHICVEEETLRPRVTPGAASCRCLLVVPVLDALDLVRESPGRVRECADPSCPVLFVDTSRNRSRRWCSMEGCGARAKAATYYRRHRA